MKIRDRVRELRRVRGDELLPNPRNWRSHPPQQQKALRGVLSEVGYADALIVRELDDGRYELIDGHLRAETTPDMLVPVLVVDLSAEEADKLLAVHDPLAAMAEVNLSMLTDLLQSVETQSEAVQSMLDNLVKSAGGQHDSAASDLPEVELPTVYQVLVECADEDEQKEVFEQLSSTGHKCRVLTL